MSPQPLTGDPSTVAVVCVECQNGVLGTDSVLPNLTAETTGSGRIVGAD